MITPDGQETLQQRSPWFVALGIVLTIFVISALMLLYYLTPGGGDLFAERIRPTAATTAVRVRIGGQNFVIPAHYMEYASARKGGTLDQADLFARLPDLNGWSGWQAKDFSDDSPDSPVLYLTLRADPNHLNEADRLRRVYGDYVENLTGTPADFGLRKLNFRKGSGYAGRDMFVGQSDGGPVILICERRSREVPGPNCLRDQLITKGVGLRARFKRTHLKHWKQIVRKTDALIASFRKKAAATRAS